MDTTPSLTRSPTSPSNSYCPSEASSLGYPSPDLISHQYKISSLYGVDPFCSMGSDQDTDIPLFSLGAASESGWNQTVPVQASSTSAGLPTNLSMDYGSLSTSDRAVSTLYAPVVYSPAPQTHKTQQLAASPSTVAATSRSPPLLLSRSPLSFSLAASGLPRSPGTSRSILGTPLSSYSRTAAASQFPPSSRALQIPYNVEPVSVYTQGGSKANGPDGYLSDGTASYWSQPVPAADQFFSVPDSLRQRPQTSAPERQSQAPRPRRQPRRLTTREEANFQCEVKGCGKLFSRSYNYKAHMETHDEKREYPFPCQVPDCSKRFVRKTDLQRHHQSVHMKERNHKCDYCGRLFARKDTLRRHMDDGCSKRFDIGTLDLRTEGANSTGHVAQENIWQSR